MDNFIVLDTETTWDNCVMSIGAIVANAETFQPIDAKYYIIDPEYKSGGMYDYALNRKEVGKSIICTREKAIENLMENCKLHNVNSIFAYNALFDYNHLPEFSNLNWYDIMRVAAYIQYNSKIPKNAQLCATGRLKSDYGVQPMMRMLSGNNMYFETHNALLDAIDELKIMSLLGYPLEKYIKLR